MVDLAHRSIQRQSSSRRSQQGAGGQNAAEPDDRRGLREGLGSEHARGGDPSDGHGLGGRDCPLTRFSIAVTHNIGTDTFTYIY
eukprot:1942361-Pleurochrysis_carterae.AAC.1